MDEAGNHHSQQTNTRRGNQTLHVQGPFGDRGARVGITLGEIPNVGDGGMAAANHNSRCTGRCIPM